MGFELRALLVPTCLPLEESPVARADRCRERGGFGRRPGGSVGDGGRGRSGRLDLEMALRHEMSATTPFQRSTTSSSLNPTVGENKTRFPHWVQNREYSSTAIGSTTPSA